MIHIETQGRLCIVLVHSALKKDQSQWFWCKKIWFVLICYWLVELDSSPVVTSDKWPYLLCYYVQHNHARNSQRNIEPTLHWLHGFHLFQECFLALKKRILTTFGTKTQPYRNYFCFYTHILDYLCPKNKQFEKCVTDSFSFLPARPYSFRFVVPLMLKWLVMHGL